MDAFSEEEATLLADRADPEASGEGAAPPTPRRLKGPVIFIAAICAAVVICRGGLVDSVVWAPSDDSGDIMEFDEENKCHTAEEGEECWKEVRWAQTEGIGGHPEWYPGLNNTSSIVDFQKLVHEKKPDKCAKPCTGAALEKLEEKNKEKAKHMKCPPPQVPSVETLKCVPPKGPTLMTFYMYRAQSNEDYPIENLNMADLAGVLWYLHREVVASIPRKFHITRILRYKVTMKNTKELYKKWNKQFGPFVAFDAGSAKGRNETWSKYGYVVGCQLVDPRLYNYVPPHNVSPACYPKHSPVCRSPKWYSLPGSCPEHKVKSKTAECKKKWPGGLCPSAVVTGEKNCTYFAQFAGEIRLDELEGIPDYDHWWVGHNALGGIVPNGNMEYNASADKGVNMTFWDERHNGDKCMERQEMLTDLFKKRYPNLPATYPEPFCN